MKRAWLYCTWGSDFWFLGEVENEGSFADLLIEHCEEHGDEHRSMVHLLIEGTPESDAIAAVVPTFPSIYGDQYPDLWRALGRSDQAEIVETRLRKEGIIS